MQQIEYQLTVVNGPDKGAVYRLIARKVTIGRGAECDIVIKDDAKVSRTHAEISVQDGNVEVTDISDRNRVLVNGDEVTREQLKNGAMIQLGETKLQFKFVDAVKAKLDLQVVSPRNQLNGAADFMKQQVQGLNKKVRRPNGKPSLVPMILVIALIAGVGYYMTNKNQGPPIAAKKLGSDKEILEQADSIDREVATINAERKTNGEEGELYDQAQSHYIRGFRDFNNGQYERALESFKACLALMPSHRNCQQYYNDAERQWGQVINDQIILGMRYKSQNQYTACISAFRNVMVAIKVQSDARYRDAESNLKFCEAKQGIRY